jgi:hypothetical protein
MIGQTGSRTTTASASPFGSMSRFLVIYFALAPASSIPLASKLSDEAFDASPAVPKHALLQRHSSLSAAAQLPVSPFVVANIPVVVPETTFTTTPLTTTPTTTTESTKAAVTSTVAVTTSNATANVSQSAVAAAASAAASAIPILQGVTNAPAATATTATSVSTTKASATTTNTVVAAASEALSAAAAAAAAAAITTTLEGTVVNPIGVSTTTASATPAAEIIDGTITEYYWQKVDAAIANAGILTPKPRSLNDAAPTPTPEPWLKILGTSETVEVRDTADDAADAVEDYNYATPPPPIPSNEGISNKFRKMSVLPYEMALGADLMYEISEKNTPSPLPQQAIVDQTFMAQCPMLMMGDSVLISPPGCAGSSLGQWLDPSSQRTVLRWTTNDKGGMDFGVDSAVSGPGSAKVAEIDQQLGFQTSNSYALYNCMGVLTYNIEETTTKVAAMSPSAESTALGHDVSQTQAAVFYQYTIKLPNGTSVAQTSLFRLNHNEVNFTTLTNGIPSGSIALAQRMGSWSGEEWRSCGPAIKGWQVNFGQTKGSDLRWVSTAQDLQVAATFIVTLMAWQEETVSADGLKHAGQAALYKSIIKSILIVVFLLVTFAAGVTVFRSKGLDKKFKRFCFKLEAVVLPMRPHVVRAAPLKPTW